MRSAQSVWGMVMILVGLASLFAYFSERSPVFHVMEPIVTLSPEPVPPRLATLLEVSSLTLSVQPTAENVLPHSPVVADKIRGSEDTKEILPSSPRRLASSPLLGWPVMGEITQGFGCSPYYTGLAGVGCPAETPWFHDGTDIGAEYGTPVRAALTGTVIFAGPDGSGPLCDGGYRGYGLAAVVINGAGWHALYAHLSQLKVSIGQAVTPKTIIGQVGATGCVTGAHLHFGLRYDSELVDPMELQE